MKFSKIFTLSAPIKTIGVITMLIFMQLLAQATDPFMHSITLEVKGRIYQFSVIYQEMKLNTKSLVSYSWHRNGQLQTTRGDYSGNILHGVYQEFDKSGRMLGKGTFHYGTKDGEWKFWNSMGEIIQLEKWNKGFLKKRIIYEQSKCTVEEFQHNQINRRVIFNSGQKKTVEKYKKGVLVVKNKKRIKPIHQSKKQKKVSDVGSDK